MAGDRHLIAREGDKLDLLIWRDASLGADHLTAVMDANPGLADIGPLLPLGTIVILPASAIAQGNAPRTLPLVQLWS